MRHFLKLAVAVVAILPMTGCVDVFDCGQVVSVGWYEPGLYNAFPPPGRINGYNVWYTDAVTDYKEAQNGAVLKVFEDDHAVWAKNADEPLNATATRAAFEQTFVDLGLRYPSNFTGELKWYGGSCA